VQAKRINLLAQTFAL